MNLSGPDSLKPENPGKPFSKNRISLDSRITRFRIKFIINDKNKNKVEKSLDN